MKNRGFNTVSKTANASDAANCGRLHLRQSLVPRNLPGPSALLIVNFPPHYTYVKYNTSQDLIGTPQWPVIAPARASSRPMVRVAGCFRCHRLPFPEPFYFRFKVDRSSEATRNPPNPSPLRRFSIFLLLLSIFHPCCCVHRG